MSTTDRPLRVVVADDSVLLRDGVVRLLADSGMEVVSAATTAPVSSKAASLSVIAARMISSCHSKGMDRSRTQSCQ